METEQMVFDPFSIRSLLTLPALDGDDSSAWRLSPFEQSLIPATFCLDIPEEVDLQKLQTDLFSLNLDDVPLSDLDSTTDSAVITDVESDGSQWGGAQPELEEEDNVWAFPDVIHGTRKDGLLSWDNFADSSCTKPTPDYLSEAGRGTFGQTLHLATRKDNEFVLKHAEPNILQASLRELSLGGESVFFGFDPIKAAFAARFEAYTLPDVSVVMLDGLITAFLQLGTDMWALRSLIINGCVSSRNRVRVALSAAIGVAIYALESAMRISSTKATSSLQLQEAIRKPGIIAASLRNMAEHCPEDIEDMAPFMGICDTLSESYPWLREILQEIVARSVSSQVEAIGHSVGIGTTTMFSWTSNGKSELKPVSTGKLLAEEATEVLIESQNVLALLRDSCPDHQLLAYSTTPHTALQWDYSWEAISKLQAKATEYETSLKQAILNIRKPAYLLQDSQSDPLHSSAEEQLTSSQEPGHPDLGVPTVMQTVLGNEVTSCRDTLYHTVSRAIISTDAQSFDLQPPLDQSMSLSLMPLLTAQHRLLSYSILSLLFESHNLRTHLLIQCRFQLLGDGLFASRLDHALFNSSEASGEGMRRKGGRTGLRLRSRDTWPPASSELRLVLMGVLSESISSEARQAHQNKSPIDVSAPLHQCLSFAIRDLSDADLEKCRDADTIHALDFLALQYKPPTPLLEAVITPRSLKLYDDIFVHLLRLLRVKSAAQELVRDVATRARSRTTRLNKNHRTRIQVHHFVSTLADWVQNTVIGQKWASFAGTLDRVEKCLAKQDYNGALEVGKGLEFIKSLHEGVIEDIGRALFLTRKYTEVRAVLDHIFDVVLELAKHIRTGESADGGKGNDETIRQLDESFHKEAKSFLIYLRFNSNDTGERDSKGPEALMEQLSLKLDMFGFYTERI